MGYYLIDNPNPHGPHYYTTRRTCQHGFDGPHLIVLHTAENLPDYQGEDEGAEKVARYASQTTRAVSWHATVDSDSIIWMLPDQYTAFHVRSFNRCGLGIEMATQAARWVESPWPWRKAILLRAAQVVSSWSVRHGIPLTHIADGSQKGVITHATLDPERRSDPGQSFPLDWVLDRAKEFAKANATPNFAGTPILGPAGKVTVAQAQAWAQARGAHQRFIDVAPLYWQLAPTLEVRPEVAYAQSYKETGGGHFKGTVPPEYHNWCGLKTTVGGANDDPGAHAAFPDDSTGVLAHLQHLALYAGQVVPPHEVVDPRHFLYLRGTATTVEGLGGRWAPSPDYGHSIRDDYLKPLLAFETAITPTGPLTETEVAEVRKLLGWAREGLWK